MRLNKLQKAVDDLGIIKEQLKALKAEEQRLVDVLNKKVGHIAGAIYQATVFEQQATLFDKEIAKQFLTVEQYAACEKKGEKHNSVRVTKK